MYLLAIETSCDETAVAVLRCPVGEGRPELLGEIISSQLALHEQYGGVVPELASREHLHNLPVLIERVLKQTGRTIADLGGVAATRGPGLKGCLLIGCGVAKALALTLDIPFIGVNHIEGHLLAPHLDNPELSYPWLALVVSGGHTEIVEVRGLGEYRLIARTMDDAAGEAFDKSANLLGLTYPGGPRLAALADETGTTPFRLPRIMPGEGSFSFSGLKTAISLLIKEQREALAADLAVRGQIAVAVQEAIVQTLVEKLAAAVRATGIATVVVTGGVSANRRLRTAVGALPGVSVFFPRGEHCTDNAAMIGYVGALRLARGERTGLECEVLSRWPVETMGGV